MCFWTNHWLHRSWRDDVNAEYKPLCHAASNTFRRRGVSPGDMVYIVSLADGQLLLGGRMTVKQIVSRDEVVQYCVRMTFTRQASILLAKRATALLSICIADWPPPCPGN